MSEGTDPLDEIEKTEPSVDGRRIGHFRLIRPLGKGAAAVVYLAEDEEIAGRTVALKLVKPEGLSPDIDSIRKEAAALSALHHPNILVVHEIGVDLRQVFLITEFMERGSLEELLRGGSRLATLYGLEIARAIAGALSTTHDQGILHRDIKPANILLSGDGTPKLGDFGLSLRDPLQRSEIALSQASTRSVHESSGFNIAGTPGYIAPEILQGHRPTSASDQFSFGVTLHEILTGARLYDRPSWVQDILNGNGRIGGSLPADLARIVRRCLHSSPPHRFQSMRAVCDALDRAVRRRSPERRRLHWLAYAVAALALTGGGLMGWSWHRRLQEAKMLNEVGARRLEAGDREGARRSFLSSNQVAPDYLPACTNLGSLAGIEENPRWALTLLDQCATRFPHSAVILYNLGVLESRFGNRGGAVDHLRQALATCQDPGLLTVILNEVVLLLLAQGQAQEAISLLDEATHPLPTTIDGAILEKTYGLALLAAGRMNDAVPAFRRSLLGPLPARMRGVALEAMGRALENLGDRTAAAEAFSQTILFSNDEAMERAARDGLRRLQDDPFRQNHGQSSAP